MCYYACDSSDRERAALGIPAFHTELIETDLLYVSLSHVYANVDAQDTITWLWSSWAPTGAGLHSPSPTENLNFRRVGS